MRSDSEACASGDAPDPGGLQLPSCSACRTVGYADDLYCARCGAPLGPACSRCGTPVTHPVAFYCVRCGGKL